MQGVSARLSKSSKYRDNISYLCRIIQNSIIIASWILPIISWSSIRKCIGCSNNVIFTISCPYYNIATRFSLKFIKVCLTNFDINFCGIVINRSNSCCSASISFVDIRKSSRWNESERERCHRYQRHNLLRDLIQLYSLPINFTRSFACPHSGAGVAVRPSLASCGTRRPLPPCTSTTASAVAPGTGRIIPAWRYAVAVFPLPIT